MVVDIKKRISINIPVFNEVGNIAILVEEISSIFLSELNEYDYEIVFADNKSTDGSRELISTLARNDKHIKAIFNASNVGHRSGLHLLRQTSGDCTIIMAGDLQDPPQTIIRFVRAWEEGYKVVVGVKTASNENKMMYLIRGLYYRILNKISNINQLEHFTGFGLYDKAFMDLIRSTNDPLIYMRSMIPEYVSDFKTIEYVQQKRKSGKSKSNFYYLFSVAMRGITSNSDIPLHIATIAGFFLSIGSFAAGIIYLILKLLYWNSFPIGMAPMLISSLFIGSVVLFFIGIVGEYIMLINKRIMNYPLVLEEKRINFDQINNKKEKNKNTNEE